MKSAAIIAAAALAIALCGCEDKDSRAGASGRPAAGAPAAVASQASAGTAPGKITVIAGDRPIGKTGGDQFRAYGIDGQTVVRYGPEEERSREDVKEVAAQVLIRNAPWGSLPKELLQKRMSRQFIVDCSACHDDYGNGVIGPSLLKKSGQEVYDMIDKYRRDLKSNILMRRLVLNMTTEEIQFIANDIARFNKEYRIEQQAAQAARGGKK